MIKLSMNYIKDSNLYKLIDNIYILGRYTYLFDHIQRMYDLYGEGLLIYSAVAGVIYDDILTKNINEIKTIKELMEMYPSVNENDGTEIKISTFKNFISTKLKEALLNGFNHSLKILEDEDIEMSNVIDIGESSSSKTANKGNIEDNELKLENEGEFKSNKIKIYEKEVELLVKDIFYVLSNVHDLLSYLKGNSILISPLANRNKNPFS
uniref:Uncharacterized protein n=1 Tax=Meloidogyne enterolobii TaxID=390850 RepID=A0A6V7X8X5_MELEN|nr:unnamed protein product [Meloidogyne enterolobii]